MAELRFRILNVFTADGERLSGNPLCVFEDGSGLSTDQMQALARQFNLSETTFLLPAASKDAHARVRIFTPSLEMPFAGHPTLGSAHVVRSLFQPGNHLVLEMPVGNVEVVLEEGSAETGDRWTLRTARSPQTRPPAADRNALAAMLGLPPQAVVDTPLWVDTGAEQLVIPLASADDVRQARPYERLLSQHGYSEKAGESMAYVWAPLSDDEVLARFFFIPGSGVVEDPATGSACANLGGWFVAMRRELPLVISVQQGEAVGRPSVLHLRVDAESRIFVGGAVEELGAGTIRL